MHFLCNFFCNDFMLILCAEHIEGMAQDAMIVIAAEVVVDWVKHAFITKFNEISAEVRNQKCWLTGTN